MADLVLDTKIRDWVLVPLTIVMILIGILRYYVTKMMKSDQKVDMKAIKEGQVVLRARFLRSSAGILPARAFRARRAYFCNEENGLLFIPKSVAGSAAANPMMTDPTMAVDMMKKNLGMIVPQTLTFAYINFFFYGFVTAKVPFPLTQRFRGMLQSGIDLRSVDVSYVSSVSWYLLNFMGLRGLFSLILGEENATDDAQRLMQSQMAMQMGDPSKMLSAEKDALDLLQHEWVVPASEGRAANVLRQRLS